MLDQLADTAVVLTRGVIFKGHGGKQTGGEDLAAAAALFQSEGFGRKRKSAPKRDKAAPRERDEASLAAEAEKANAYRAELLRVYTDALSAISENAASVNFDNCSTRLKNALYQRHFFTVCDL